MNESPEPTDVAPLRLVGMVLARTMLWVLFGLAFWAVCLIPTGMLSTVIASGSMRPAIHTGDVIVARSIDQNIEVLGRVVVAENPAKPGTLLSHRIVVDNLDGTYTTRGDANRDADSTPLRRENIKGRGFILVPWIGLPAHWLATGQYLLLALASGGLALLLLVARDPAAAARRTPRLSPVESRWAKPGLGGLVAASVGVAALVTPVALDRSAASFVALTSNNGISLATAVQPTDPGSSGNIVDNDQGAPLFNGTILTANTPVSRVIKVDHLNQGNSGNSVQLKAALASTGQYDAQALSHLNVKVERGTGGGASFGDPAGFTSTSTVYNGTLAGLVNTPVGLGQLKKSEQMSLRFTVTWDGQPGVWTSTVPVVNFQVVDPVEGSTWNVGNSWAARP